MIAATAALESLEALLAEAGGRRRLVSVTVPVELEDPSAAVFASRLAGDRWFCWEQPDRDGFALAALGSAHEVISRGPERFGDLVAACAEVARGRLSDEPDRLARGRRAGLGRRVRVRARRRAGGAVVLVSHPRSW